MEMGAVNVPLMGPITDTGDCGKKMGVAAGNDWA